MVDEKNVIAVPEEIRKEIHMLETRYDIQFRMEEYDDPVFYSLAGLSEIVAGMVIEKSRQEVKPCANRLP